MLLAILSDIHANLEALDAVLADAGSCGAESYVCLGDVVGYGADPNECCKRLRENGSLCILGNHDAAATGEEILGRFRDVAATANRWTRTVLSDENRSWLESLPVEDELAGVTLVHASLADDLRWEQGIFTHVDADEHLRQQPTRIGFCGHTHLPGLFVRGDDSAPCGRPLVTQRLPPKKKILVNPGSVGQPRDGDQRASYCLFDTEDETLVARRVDYDNMETARKIIDAGLPPGLADRLFEAR